MEKENVVYDSFEEPIVAKVIGKSKTGLIASSKIPTCYPYGFANYADLNGASFMPGVPSFDDICKAQKASIEKEDKYFKMADLEETVRNKMQASIDKMNVALEMAEANFKI